MLGQNTKMKEKMKSAKKTQNKEPSDNDNQNVRVLSVCQYCTCMSMMKHLSLFFSYYSYLFVYLSFSNTLRISKGIT